ncbi:MAG: hypothetical protein WC716_10390 [Chitinophagaceae bacterium]|jgi:hypothetical protein
MKEKDLFDKCFKQKGGHFDYTTLVQPKIFEFLLNGCRNDIKSIRTDNPNLPEVYFDFIKNTSLNACASKMDGKYFIGINIGTYFLISDLFFRMLATKTILPEYGDISNEDDVKKIFNAQITDTNILYVAKDPHEKVAPKGIVRHHLAQLLTSFAIKFLVMHEYGHIIYGHVDYLENKTKNCYWSEIAETNNDNKLDSLFSQTLEMDADCYGINIGITQLISYSENINKIKEELNKFYSPLESSLSLWFFSIYSLFRLFGYHNRDIEKMKVTHHPQSGIRQHIVFASTHTIFQSKPHYKELLEKIPRLALKTIQTVEKAFEEISMQGYDSKAIKIAYERESQDHVLFLMRNWNNVRPKLEKFAKGNLKPIYVE